MKAEELAVIKERERAVISDGWYYDGSTVRQTHCIPVIWSDGDGPRMNDEVGQFIANARQDVPKLVADVERLQARLSECESLLGDAYGLLDDVHCYETETYEAITKYFYGDDDE